MAMSAGYRPKLIWTLPQLDMRQASSADLWNGKVVGAR